MQHEIIEGQSFELLADLVLTAGERVPSISIEAYNGGLMYPTINGKAVRAVVDLAGLEIDSQRKPILKAHDQTAEVGHTESIVNNGARLLAEGIASGAGPAAAQVINSAKSKFPWKASIGVHIEEYRLVAQGESARVNGRVIEGPYILVTRSKLKEISAVTIGGDDSSSLSIAANAAGVFPMDQTDPNAEAAKVSAEAATAPVTPKVDTLQASTGNDVGFDIQQVRQARAAESMRISKIETLCAKHGDIAAQAISEGWSIEKAELAVLRAERPKAPAAIIRENISTPLVLEAAFCMAGKLGGIEKQFDEKTLDTANRMYRGGATASIQRVLLEAARANGYHGMFFDKTASGIRDVLQAAFSTRDISGILSNTANKFLLQGYNFVEQSWRKIASIRPVTDFKTVTSYRLTDDSKFEEVPASGLIPHGELDEVSFTNRAKTYGKMYGLTRQDLINDDLGAFTSMQTRLGRGAGLKLNSVFWTAWLTDTSHFSNSNSPDNLAASALGVAGLTVVETQFNGFTDANSNPLGSTARILLVPPALHTTARQLMNSTGLATGSDTTIGNTNPFANQYEVVMSRYLTDSDAWYLLADPMDISGIEVAFLNGVETPTVETADADFNTLGIQMRGYFDFGVSLQDFRCGVKSNAS